MVLNFFDSAIIHYVNHFAHRSWAFDFFISTIGSNALLKTGVLVGLLSWAWFRASDDTDRDHATIIAGLVSTCGAVLAARVLAACLPFRDRPFRSPDLHFVLPYLMSGDEGISWKTFPSDHAVLFFGVAMCIFLVSRRAGIVAFCHVLLVVALARVYAGYHYPSDIAAGAVIGVGAVALSQLSALKRSICSLPMHWLEHRPGEFYSAFVLLLFLIGTTFEPLYPVIHVVVTEIRATTARSAPRVREGLQISARMR